MRPGKILREDAALVKGTRTPAPGDTTSEPRVGNVPPGAPVTASMSGSAVRGNQGGTVEYCIYCIPPLILQGMGYFFTLPKLKGGKHHVRRKSVHL